MSNPIRNRCHNMKSKDEYILDVVRPMRDAVTQTAFATAIEGAKENLSREKVEERVRSAVYSAAYSIAEKVAYVRTACDTAHWLTAKLPNVERLAYNAAINAAKVTYNVHYNDPDVQTRIAAAIMRDMIAG